jgi:hypothetical protein
MNIYYDQIYEIENFITIEQQNKLLSIIENSSEQDWPGLIENEFVKEDDQWGGKILFMSRDTDGWIEQIESLVQSLFNNFTRINPISAIQRYLPDTGMGQHVDDGFDKKVKFGVVIYINDDYEGGEISYPTLEFKIKPKARSLIIHSASLPHLVEKVTGENTRYILSTFISGEDVSIKTEVANGI